MAITYLSGKRIQGSSTSGDADTLGSSADGTLIGSPTSEDTTPTPPTGLGTKSFSFDGSDDAINIDGAEPFSTTVGSISLWYSSSDAGQFAYPIGFGDTNANEYMNINVDSGNIATVMKASAGVKWENSNTGGAGADTWHHIVLSQDGTTVQMYVDGVEDTSWVDSTDRSVWMLSGIDNARIGCINKNSSGNTNFFDGNIMEVGLWNVALTSDQVESLYGNGDDTAKKANTISAGLRAYYPLSGTTITNEAVVVDDKTTVTDVPLGSEFEETDTYKFYQMSDTWVTTSGSLSAGVYHPSGKGDATDGWNTTGIGVVGGGNRPELDLWNGTTWQDDGTDMTKAMEGACGVGTSSSITVAGGDYQSDDSGAGNACQYWSGVGSWNTMANMNQGKSTASSMGTPSSWLSCGGEITGGGGGRTAEVQKFDYDGTGIGAWTSGTSMPSGASIDGVNQSAGDGTSTSNGMCVGGRSTDYTITVSANAFNGTNWTSVSVPDISWSMYAGIGGGNYDGFWVMGGNLSGGYGTGIGAVTYYNGTSWTTKANCALTEGGAGGANNGGTNPQIGGGNEVGESGNGNWTSGQYWGGAWLERGTT